jgi:kynurenine formamidase
MIVEININNRKYKVDYNKPIDLSLTSKVKNSFKAWYVDEIKINTIKNDDFTGSVKDGGAVNFREILINPHGNMTHTESVGHISKEDVNVNKLLKAHNFLAQIITIKPQKKVNYSNKEKKEIDEIIMPEQIKNKIQTNTQALIIRTQKNYTELTQKNYNHTNWPFLSESAADYIRNMGVEHLLIDQPSVDKEFDEGKLLAHRAFWNYPNELDLKRTITELIGIPDHVNDGKYLLNLTLANIENDAVPSRPIIYELF